MKTKHTPGPLLVSENKSGACMVVTEKMAAVAEIWSPVERARADANLFAAAPEMYEFLKGLSKWESPPCKDGLLAILRKAEGGK